MGDGLKKQEWCEGGGEEQLLTFWKGWQWVVSVKAGAARLAE